MAKELLRLNSEDILNFNEGSFSFTAEEWVKFSQEDIERIKDETLKLIAAHPDYEFSIREDLFRNAWVIKWRKWRLKKPVIEKTHFLKGDADGTEQSRITG